VVPIIVRENDNATAKTIKDKADERKTTVYLLAFSPKEKMLFARYLASKSPIQTRKYARSSARQCFRLNPSTIIILYRISSYY
jgi:hypothetical protein